MVLSFLHLVWAAPLGATFYTGTYPADHWALRAPRAGDDNFIGIITVGRRNYGVVLHPLDRRGYRALVMLTDPNMASVLNRPYAWDETLGLYTALAQVAAAYEDLGLIAQTLVLGNNAHAFDPATCAITLGSAAEPLMLHGHVLGRGDPARAYAGGVALGGPAPGEVFGVRDRSSPWTPDERARVARVLRAALVRVSLRANRQAADGPSGL